jgi:putative lipase involved disintegration of autophagic bodies
VRLLSQFPAHRIALTGHSLGGAVVIALSEELGLPAVAFNPAAPVGIRKRVYAGAAARGVLFARPLLGFFGLGSKLINKVGEGTWLGLAGSSSRKVGAFKK